MKRKSAIKDGTCKLTLEKGRFVDSHIIPKAFTNPAIAGHSFVQYGQGRRPSKRWSSWYDPQLVTAEGELYLSKIDDWAVRELRRHKLVWSGWSGASDLGDNHTLLDGTFGVRQVQDIDQAKLRLFFLSLLWRAAASSLDEMKDIVVSPDLLEQLRLMIINNNARPLELFPCQLTQLSTLGIVHNHGPIRDVKYVPDLTSIEDNVIELNTFRFYFDGLIIHMHLDLVEKCNIKDLGGLIVGSDEPLTLSTVTFQDSFQFSNMQEVLVDSDISPD